MRKFFSLKAAFIIGLAFFAVSFFNVSAVGALPASNVASASRDYACDGLNTVDGAQSCDASSGKLDGIVSAAVNIISFIAGIAAVIMVVVAGFKYITSGGDATKVGSAKNSLIYALIGVAIVVLAQILVHFVVVTADNATDGKCHDGIKGHASLSVNSKDCGS